MKLKTAFIREALVKAWPLLAGSVRGRYLTALLATALAAFLAFTGADSDSLIGSLILMLED